MTESLQTMVPVRFIQDDLLLTQWSQLHRQVTHRAFELFEAAGREHGHAREHWLRAEAEVHNRVTLRMEETQAEIRLSASLKLHFNEQIEIGLRPNHLFILSSPAGRNGGNSVQQFPLTHILKCVRLSCALQPQRVSAYLSGERLEVVIAKQPVHVAGDIAEANRAA